MYLLILGDAFISLLDIGAIILLLLIVNFYTQPASNLPISFLPESLRDKSSLLLIAVFLAAFCIKNIFAYFLQHMQYKFVYSVASRLSETKLLQYLEGSYSDYVSVDSSVFIQKISQQPIEFSQHVLAGIHQIFTQIFLILLTVMAILLFNAKLFLFVMILLIPPVIIVALIIKKRTKSARKQVKTSGQETLQHVKEALASYIESNIYDKELFFTIRYTGSQQKLNKHLSDLQSIQALPGRMMEVFAVLGFFILLAISKWTGNNGAVDILTIGMFMAAAYKIIPGLVKILNSSGQVHTYDYTIQDLLPQELNGISKKEKVKNNSIRSIEFNDISFNYDHKKILSGVSYTFKAGEFIGISGISGKGKTTLMNLLLGFISPDNGLVRINDIALDANGLQQYWPAVSYVKQEPFLINDSIIKNITLDELLYDAKKMDEAIQATGLKPLLDQYPEGIHQYITENGKNISGGQRQRIVIARALYKNADLIILDEPFNELDRNSENMLLKYFQGLAAARKIIVLITHDKESLSFCDKIISLDEA